MNIAEFRLYNPPDEYTLKIIREVLMLFHIDITPNNADAPTMRLQNHVTAPRTLASCLTIRTSEKDEETLNATTMWHDDERDAAGYHRAVKLNLYSMLRRRYDFPPAPWGILHGVRPAKIACRWLQEGMTREEVTRRLIDDYDTSAEKAALLTFIAKRQLPVIDEDDEKKVSVYVGIPFCRTRCLYCSFPSNVLPNEKHLRDFMEVFTRDVTAARNAIRRNNLKVDNIYIGGGTPTSLPDGFFADMMNLVTDCFWRDESQESTVEAGRPDTITDEKINTMAKCHVNRVSLNPQTMKERTLKIIGRQHTPEEIIDKFRRLRATELFHINMDIIIGLPGEDAADVADTMANIAALNPDSLTVHTLTLKRGSHLKYLFDETPADAPILPSDGEMQKMYNEATLAAKNMGMTPYYLYRQGAMKGNLDNIGFCRDDTVSRYNIKIMAERQTIIGTGGAASTKIMDRKANRLHSVFNPKDLTVYMREIDGYIKKRDELIDKYCGE